jgi:hypothetical protein
MKLATYLFWLAVVTASGVMPVGAENNRRVYFSQNPTANKCGGILYAIRLKFRDGDFILLQPRSPGEVITDKSVVSLRYKNYKYLPASSADIVPLAVCYFSECQAREDESILLTCGRPESPGQHVLFIRKPARERRSSWAPNRATRSPENGGRFMHSDAIKGLST